MDRLFKKTHGIKYMSVQTIEENRCLAITRNYIAEHLT